MLRAPLQRTALSGSFSRRTRRKNKKRLLKTIACDSSLSLPESVEILANKPAFNQLCIDAFKDLQSGHGGAMVDTMRRAARTLPQGEYDEITSAYLNRNTYGGQISDIKVRAAMMLDRLMNDPDAADSLKGEYRRMALDLNGLCDTVKDYGSKRLPHQEDEEINIIPKA